MGASTALAAFITILQAVSLVSGHSSSTGRKLQMSQGPGRKLLDIDVQGTSSFSLTAFGASGNTPNGNCFLQGYPGSRGDSTVAGPLTVKVYPSDTTTIYFSRGSETFFSNYNYSGNVGAIKVNQNETYGLGSVVFSPQAVGQSVNVFSGLVPTNSPITLPTCFVNITFVTVARPSPPPATPTPTSTPSPTSNPAPAGTCTGIIPCYCQNGYCFNNGATLSPSCIPPAGQTCTPTSVNPSAIGVQYAFGYGSSVNVCKCTTAGG